MEPTREERCKDPVNDTVTVHRCTGCGVKLKVPNNRCGQTGKCPKCGAAFKVPAQQSQPPLMPPESKSVDLSEQVIPSQSEDLLTPTPTTSNDIIDAVVVLDHENNVPLVPTNRGTLDSMLDPLGKQPWVRGYVRTGLGFMLFALAALLFLFLPFSLIVGILDPEPADPSRPRPGPVANVAISLVCVGVPTAIAGIGGFLLVRSGRAALAVTQKEQQLWRTRKSQHDAYVLRQRQIETERAELEHRHLLKESSERGMEADELLAARHEATTLGMTVDDLLIRKRILAEQEASRINAAAKHFGLARSEYVRVETKAHDLGMSVEDVIAREVAERQERERLETEAKERHINVSDLLFLEKRASELGMTVDAMLAEYAAEKTEEARQQAEAARYDISIPELLAYEEVARSEGREVEDLILEDMEQLLHVNILKLAEDERFLKEAKRRGISANALRRLERQARLLGKDVDQVLEAERSLERTAKSYLSTYDTSRLKFWVHADSAGVALLQLISEQPIVLRTVLVDLESLHTPRAERLLKEVVQLVTRLEYRWSEFEDTSVEAMELGGSLTVKFLYDLDYELIHEKGRCSVESERDGVDRSHQLAKIDTFRGVIHYLQHRAKSGAFGIAVQKEAESQAYRWQQLGKIYERMGEWHAARRAEQ